VLAEFGFETLVGFVNVLSLSHNQFWDFFLIMVNIENVAELQKIAQRYEIEEPCI
jgi:hypothetical protein